ncbi:MAG: DUF6788 family protein [Planctomycetota bacterium]
MPEISRTSMSAQERRLRSQVAQLLDGAGIVHGTLVEREKSCGKTNCRCARGEKHRALYLTLNRDKKLRQLYIPKSLEETVRRWVQQDRIVRDLLDDVSELHWEKLREAKKKG